MKVWASDKIQTKIQKRRLRYEEIRQGWRGVLINLKTNEE
jgi:hypothetical protein